jgi:mannose-6-phosphate isomerase-like protein (cupin superfamily)
MAEGVTQARIDFGSNERFASLRRELGVTSFGLNVLTLEPRQRGRIHRHEQQEEVYVVLRGTLTLGLHGEELDVAEGEAVRVAPEVRRQLVNRGAARLVLLAIGGAGEHVGRDGEAFAGWNHRDGRAPQEIPLPDDLPASG